MKCLLNWYIMYSDDVVRMHFQIALTRQVFQSMYLAQPANDIFNRH